MATKKNYVPYIREKKLFTDQQLLDELRRRGGNFIISLEKCTDEELFNEMQSRGYSGQIAKRINLDKEILPGF